MAGPLGSTRPWLNRCSAIPVTLRGYLSGFWNTGCRCIGFHTGRDSMPRSASASRSWDADSSSVRSQLSITSSTGRSAALRRRARATIGKADSGSAVSGSSSSVTSSWRLP